MSAITVAILALAVASCGGGTGEGSVAEKADTSALAEGAGAGGNTPGSSKEEHPRKKARRKEEKGGSKGSQPGHSSPSAGKAQTDEGAGSGEASTHKEASPGGHPSPSNEFRKQARAICLRSRRELLHEVGEYLKNQAPQNKGGKAMLAVSRNVLIPSMEGQIAQLRSLNPPPTTTPGANAFLASWQRALKATMRESKPLIGAHAEAILAPAARSARRAGLGACAYG